MKYLFIDTSFTDVSIATLEDKKILNLISKSIPNQHSVYTVSYIDQVLKDSNLEPEDIDKIFVVTGPGSFTGVRIGVTIAKTYGYVLDKDIIEVSSLKARIISKNNEYLLSLIDAKNDNYYIGLYDSNYQDVIEERFDNINNINKLIEEYNPYVLTEKDDYDISAIVEYYSNKEGSNPHQIKPNYIRKPQAMEQK